VQSSISYSIQVDRGKKIVTDYITFLPEKAQISEMRWLDQDLESFAQHLWSLGISFGRKKRVITFPEAHVSNARKTNGEDRLLRERVDRFFHKLKIDAVQGAFILSISPILRC
jgi:hypothetical protein